MSTAALLLTLLTLATGGAAALLTANLATSGHARMAKREALLAAVHQKRQAHRERVRRVLAAFDEEFDDIEIVFDDGPILPKVPGKD